MSLCMLKVALGDFKTLGLPNKALQLVRHVNMLLESLSKASMYSNTSTSQFSVQRWCEKDVGSLVLSPAFFSFFSFFKGLL